MKKDTGTVAKTPILAFEHPFKIEVYVPDFEPLSSVVALDASFLSEGEHRVEIGHMKGGGCSDILVRAVIQDGMVVAIEAEECESSKEAPSEGEASEEIAALLAHAAEELGQFDYWKPVPVKEFMTMLKDGSYPPRAGTGAGCFYLCYWKYCLFCCWSTAKHSHPWCWIERRKPDVIMGV